jgi:hypothetical protein
MLAGTGVVGFGPGVSVTPGFTVLEAEVVPPVVGDVVPPFPGDCGVVGATVFDAATESVFGASLPQPGSMTTSRASEASVL